MVDLVHPSLYCYERGKTLVLPVTGAEVVQQSAWDDFLGVTGIVENPRQAREMESKSGLQWLPSEFHVKGDNCEINSYINSLHPVQYSDTYNAIGSLFVQAIPLLEDALAKAHVKRDLRVPVHGWYTENEPRDREEGEDEDEYDNYLDEHWLDPSRVFVPPEIPEFAERDFDENRSEMSLRDRPLQVIVKLASLELKPGESYGGGAWHVEGALDERIVATACCYLDSANVSGGDPSFRTAVCEPSYEQNDNDGVRNMYGLEDGGALVQDLGSCSTPAGRILAWPNTLQHRVGPVRLVDESLPGKRTICCFFLVDPILRIRSTATVPPQQLAWLSQSSEPILGAAGLAAGVCGKILQNLASPSMMTYDQACERRQRLMDERQAIFRGDDPFYEQAFNLCEH
jgi:hypothetical protein